MEQANKKRVITEIICRAGCHLDRITAVQARTTRKLLSGSLMGIMAVAAFPQALQQVYSGVLKGAGDTYYIMKYSLVSVAIIRPIITYLLCITLGLGLFGAWLSLCFDQSLRLCCSYLRFIRGTWQHKVV